jgi:hypothetical protein
MKKYLLSFYCVLISLFLAAQHKVIISELLYDTPYQNEGQNPNMYNGEFVSIYNYGDVPVNVSQWRLQSDGQNPFIFPANSILPPGAKFYVAYSTNGFSLSDLYKGFQLQENDKVFYYSSGIIHNNTGECVRLYRADGTTVQDLMCYGNETGSTPLLNATNTIGTPGDDCRSVQRINVTIENDAFVFKGSDWTVRRVRTCK